MRARFMVQPIHTDSWFAIGYDSSDEEIWTDNGIILKDKRLVERVARNMQVAYEAGVADTIRKMRSEQKKMESDLIIVDS